SETDVDCGGTCPPCAAATCPTMTVGTGNCDIQFLERAVNSSQIKNCPAGCAIPAPLCPARACASVEPVCLTNGSWSSDAPCNDCACDPASAVAITGCGGYGPGTSCVQGGPIVQPQQKCFQYNSCTGTCILEQRIVPLNDPSCP